MYLRDHPMLNLVRRLRGWRPGDARLMVEARDGSQHFFCVYECRAETRDAGHALLDAALAADGAELVEIAQETEARVPMPPAVDLIRLSERVYFGGEGDAAVSGAKLKIGRE